MRRALDVSGQHLQLINVRQTFRCVVDGQVELFQHFTTLGELKIHKNQPDHSHRWSSRIFLVEQEAGCALLECSGLAFQLPVRLVLVHLFEETDANKPFHFK